MSVCLSFLLSLIVRVRLPGPSQVGHGTQHHRDLLPPLSCVRITGALRRLFKLGAGDPNSGPYLLMFVWQAFY